MVSSTITTLLLVVMTSILAQAAPIKPLDVATLLKNGQAAQQLNVAFQTMKMSDPCTNADKACMSGGVAVCQNGTWNVAQGQCSKTQACFALPSVQDAGTLVTCTSDKNAVAAIEATGATGGIFGNSTATAGNGGASISASGISTTPTALTPSSSSGPTSIDTTSPTATEPETVTVTVTLGNQPTTLAPVTRTLSPQEASSVLSSLMANGATVIESPSSTVAITTAPTITAIPASSPAPPSSESSPTLVVLTAAPNATTAAPAPSQNTNSSSSSGDYGDGC